MYPCSIRTLHTHALFASALQRSDDLSSGKIRQAIAIALDGSSPSPMSTSTTSGRGMPRLVSQSQRVRPESCARFDEGIDRHFFLVHAEGVVCKSADHGR